VDNWSEEQMQRLTQLSQSIAEVERDYATTGFGELADFLYASRQQLTKARAHLCVKSID
jgi:hypothetical protein